MEHGMATDPSSPRDQVPVSSDRLCESLSTRPTVEAVANAASLLLCLRDLREFDRLCALADLVCRLRPDDAKARRLYAQGLIETGRLAAAVDVLEAAKHRYGEEHSEYAEFEGLLGRAYKQLFMDTVDPRGTWASSFIKRSFDEYGGAYARDRAKDFWHGINLGALAHVADLRGVALHGRSAGEYTTELLTALEAIEPTKRDQWWYATKAEAHAAQGEWEASEQALRTYIDHAETTPFMLASTLRQLRDLWSIQREPRGARLLQMLEATLMSRPTPGAVLKMGSPHLLEMRALEPKNDAMLQRLVGPQGFETIKWYRKGLKRAESVAAVTERLGLRFGTGFAVRAGDVCITPGDEVLLLTNFHVLNSAGLGGRKDFGNVEVVFEAISEETITFAVRCVVAESNSDDGLDYALFRLAGPVERLQPLDLSTYMEAPDSKARVYVIGYPLGDVMQFSLQDNVLLDHECEPTGKPPNPARRRVQYSASTEKGNSGSPVFDKKRDCIALHHAGGKRNPREERYGIPRLNGQSTAWEANQGIWIGSIQNDVKAKKVKLT
jgi:tetratricopeptide (TPR) repeat protein